jgi:hypothetical protein
VKKPEKSISNAIPTEGRIITLWMFFPFTGGSGGSNFGQKAWISEFVGKHPQKSKTGVFPVSLYKRYSFSNVYNILNGSRGFICYILNTNFNCKLLFIKLNKLYILH